MIAYLFDKKMLQRFNEFPLAIHLAATSIRWGVRRELNPLMTCFTNKRLHHFDFRHHIFRSGIDRYPRWESNPQNLVSKTSTYSSFVTRASMRYLVLLVGLEPTRLQGLNLLPLPIGLQELVLAGEVGIEPTLFRCQRAMPYH